MGQHRHGGGFAVLLHILWRGAVNRANFPMVVIDPRRQPKTDQTEDDAGRARLEEEEVQLRERIRVGAVEWPAPAVAWTLGSTPATMPSGTTNNNTAEAEHCYGGNEGGARQ